MGTPFLGEIKMTPYNFPQKGWAQCNGQLLPINQNQALFSLLGTQYGGNGQTTFALPDLRGRTPIHTGPNNSVPGTRGGEEAHTVTLQELPSQGVRRLAVISPGFAADCLETLEEIAVQGRESFLHHGGEAFTYIPALNDSDGHLDLIETLVRRDLAGWISQAA